MKSPAKPKKSELSEMSLSPELQALAKETLRGMHDWNADQNRKRLRVDPTGKHDSDLTSMMAHLLFGKPKTADLEFYGAAVLCDIIDLSPDELAARFAAIVEMKRAAAVAKTGALSKTAQWSVLRSAFKKEKGRTVESKGEFVEYAAKQGCPMPATPSGRQRYWKLLGMDHLPQSRGYGKK